MKYDEKKFVSDWLQMSKKDLAVADLIYDKQFFSQALYNLQQSNEKLVKALLVYIGILTPKKSKSDLKIKSLLGFYPKQPRHYGHRTLKPLIVDLEKMVPTIEELIEIIKTSKMGEKINEYEKLVKKSKKSLKKLKKKPSFLLEEPDKLEQEINATKSILTNYNKIFSKMDREIDQLNFQEITKVAIELATKEGVDIDLDMRKANFSQIKTELMNILKASVLICLSVSMDCLLNPLEAMTRYPDSNLTPFDENHLYVYNFRALLDIIKNFLEKADEIFIDKNSQDA